MSDLIASLVDRALGRTPIIERRRASMFEPIVNGVFKPAHVIEETDQEADANPGNGNHHKSVQLSDQTRAKSSPARPTQDVPFSNEVRANQHVIGEALPRTEFRTVTENVSFVTTTRDQDELKPVPPRRAVPDVPPPVETIVEKKAQEPDVVADDDIDERSFSQRSSTTTLETTRETYIVLDRQRRPVQSKPAIVTDNKMAQRGLRVASREKKPRLQSAIRTGPQEAIAEPPTPTINVTIGRVEVRATSHPQRAQPSRSTGPKVGLEEYLRSRGRGTS